MVAWSSLPYLRLNALLVVHRWCTGTVTILSNCTFDFSLDAAWFRRLLSVLCAADVLLLASNLGERDVEMDGECTDRGFGLAQAMLKGRRPGSCP
jgi:hypothetical protein